VADKKAKNKINSMPEKPPFRIGRFIISKSTVPAKEVSFETGESTRLSIKAIGED